MCGSASKDGWIRGAVPGKRAGRPKDAALVEGHGFEADGVETPDAIAQADRDGASLRAVGARRESDQMVAFIAMNEQADTFAKQGTPPHVEEDTRRLARVANEAVLVRQQMRPDNWHRLDSLRRHNSHGYLEGGRLWQRASHDTAWKRCGSSGAKSFDPQTCRPGSASGKGTPRVMLRHGSNRRLRRSFRGAR